MHPAITPMLAAVERGMGWLDRNYPGWADRIDPDRLQMSQCQWCVLGQLVGEFDTVLTNSGWTDGDAAEYGFTLTDDVALLSIPIPRRIEWELLTRLWQVHILLRQDYELMEDE